VRQARLAFELPLLRLLEPAEHAPQRWGLFVVGRLRRLRLSKRIAPRSHGQSFPVALEKLQYGARVA